MFSAYLGRKGDSYGDEGGADENIEYEADELMLMAAQSPCRSCPRRTRFASSAQAHKRPTVGICRCQCEASNAPTQRRGADLRLARRT